jgi:hypothetical protein
MVPIEDAKSWMLCKYWKREKAEGNKNPQFSCFLFTQKKNPIFETMSNCVKMAGNHGRVSYLVSI